MYAAVELHDAHVVDYVVVDHVATVVRRCLDELGDALGVPALGQTCGDLTGDIRAAMAALAPA